MSPATCIRSTRRQYGLGCLVMAYRRPIYTCQLKGYATESNEKYVCCFMRVTHAINNIYKLISFLK